MNWKPLGHIFKTDTYAQTPTPLVLQDRVRVYYASRENGRALIEFVDMDLDDPTKIIAGPSGRVLENGKPGTFDDEGAMPSFAEVDGHNVMLYYSGWNSRNTIPYHNATGIAYSENGGRTFFRKYDGPLLDRTQAEPYLRVTPCKQQWRMWYVSGLRWEKIGDRYEPIYVIRSKYQDDENPIVIKQQYERECFSRPWVFYRVTESWMLYSYRDAVDYRDGANSYRLGAAVQYGAELWRRCDDLISVPRSDFDQKMQCYAATFDAKGKTFMVYNGNTFGKHGFALAVAE